jgi:hypothetical protein
MARRRTGREHQPQSQSLAIESVRASSNCSSRSYCSHLCDACLRQGLVPKSIVLKSSVGNVDRATLISSTGVLHRVERTEQEMRQANTYEERRWQGAKCIRKFPRATIRDAPTEKFASPTPASTFVGLLPISEGRAAARTRRVRTGREDQMSVRSPASTKAHCS